MPCLARASMRVEVLAHHVGSMQLAGLGSIHLEVAYRSWRAMFHVTSKQEAEEQMRKQDYTWEWLAGNDCRIISKVLPAVRACSNGVRRAQIWPRR